jgi:class 3 adenylate cyclase
VDVLSTPLHCKDLTVATVRRSTGRIADALTRWKPPPSVRDSHATGSIKGELDVTVIAAETTRAAVLFADMRGYSGLAERLECARIVPLLDEFFTILARVTVAYGGQVFHLAGDGMMAGFGGADPRRSSARAALAAGTISQSTLASASVFMWAKSLWHFSGRPANKPLP